MKLESKGAWLPVDPKTTAEYMNKLREKIRNKKATRSTSSCSGIVLNHESVQNFQDLINNDAIVRMNFTKMIDQVPDYYKTDGPGIYPYLTSIDEMLSMIDEILDTAPEYNETDLVGFPINTILNWTMGVPAGAAAFRNEKVNAAFREILAEWTEFLNSGDSLYVLDKETGSWRTPAALAQLHMEEYLPDPSVDVWPYTSWNDFFTRTFVDINALRPLPSPDNPSEIVSACDSKVYNIQIGTQLQDWFWVKSQPYSLRDMLANEDGPDAQQSNLEHCEQYVMPFDGGTVYQAFLSAFKYHRWHSPVSGTIVKAYVKNGTYYSATQAEGLDQASPDLSQGYIAHTATRAIIFIQAEEPVGLMCAIFIGMAEVSSCIITKQSGTVQKGEELGYFQFGGSTHCLVFRPDVIAQFTDGQNEITKDDEINVRQLIARAN